MSDEEYSLFTKQHAVELFYRGWTMHGGNAMRERYFAFLSSSKGK